MQNFPELFKTLLEERGILSANQLDFLNPDFGRLHDPLLLADMEKARDRIIRAIENHEHIMVFSDYDADGIPGAVVLSDFFRRLRYENVSFYIPHRHLEGFGLNLQGIDEALRRGAKLIITIDCGVNNIEAVRAANVEGLDVIITDHHEPQSILPDAYAIVNPKRKDSVYPFKELCGSAVVFKLVQAVLAEKSFGAKIGMEKWSLDMVAIATLSDCVPLVDENRILAHFGLQVLRKSPRLGLATLFRNLNLDQKNLSEDDVTFMITPRINAASRMGVPLDAFKLLSTTDEREAETLAIHLEKINNERKGVVASLVKAAKASLAKREALGAVIVIGNPEWRPALLGLVANALVEEYERPVFVWGRDGDGALKGSCRTAESHDLFALMEATSGSFSEFGGHAGAGGFSITLESLTTLEEKLSQSLSLQIAQIQALGNLVSKSDGAKDLVISLSDIGDNLWEMISQFAPFGTGNAKPLFKIPQAEIKSVKSFGKENNHLEIELSNGIRAISFFSSPSSYPMLLTPGNRINLLANLEKSYFRHRPELRLRIVDITNS
jgi:single-stranded-DNA-specific exonuclease